MKILPSLRRVILRRVLPITLAVLMVIAWLTQHSMKRMIQGDVDRRLAKLSSITANQLAYRLNLLRSSARTLAENDLIINSIVDEQQREQQLAVFFRSLRLPNPAFTRATMFDYRGRPILSSQSREPIDSASFIDSVIDGNELLQIDRQRILVATAVRYDVHPEAIIAVEYDTVKFIQDYQTPAPGHRLRLFRDKQVLYDSLAANSLAGDSFVAGEKRSAVARDDQQPASQWISRAAEIPGYAGLSSEQSESFEIAYASLRMMYLFLFVGTLCIVVALLAGILYAARLATDHLSRLGNQIADIRTQNDLSRRVDDGDTREVYQLTESFNEMVASLSATTVSLDHLSESESRLRRVLRSVPNGIVATDNTGTINFANSTMLAMLGYGIDEILSMTIDQVIPGLTILSANDATTRHLLVHHEWNAIDRNGKQIPVEVTLSPVSMLNDSGLLASVVDTTERRENEMAKEHLQKETQVILDSIPASVLFKDTQNQIIRVNQTAADLIGLPPNEIEGQHAREFFDDHEQQYQDDLSVIKSRQPRLGIVHLYASSQSEYRWARTDKIPIFDQGENLTGLLVVSYDITDLKKAQEALAIANTELQTSNDELAQFAYVASHDLQEPLRKITSFCELLKEDYGDQLDEEGQLFIQYIVGGAVRMRALIQDLLAYSGVDSKGRPSELMDLRLTVENVIDSLSRQIEDAQVTITMGDLPTVWAGKFQMEQLMQNLISNAIKYRSDTSPQVHVSTETQQDSWIISVRDNGIGIDPKYHDQIFGVFKRLHSLDAYAGTGIGLAICKRIVDRLSGRMWVESTVGEGSTFFVEIPRPNRVT